MSWGPRRRFWQRAAVRPAGDLPGFGVWLDGKPLATPAGAPLLLPTEALAEAVAAEWDALATEIDPAKLPLTRAANSAIDRVRRSPGPVVEAIAEYGNSDLVCYRAATPEALAARQAAAWDPWIDWSARALDAPLTVVNGVMHAAQPAASLAALRRAVEAHDAFSLTALHDLVALSGSLVLGLAVSRDALDAETAWDLSRIDEDWQAEQWGIDAEAEAAAAEKRRDFVRARTLITLLRA